MAVTMSRNMKRSSIIFAALLTLSWSQGSILAQDPSNEGPSGGSTQAGQAGGGQVGGGPTNPSIAKTSRSARRSSRPSSVAAARRSTSSTKRPQPEESLSDKVERALEEGNAARDRRRYSEAESLYRQALGLDAKEARAYIGLGNIYFDQDRYDQAIEYYRVAIKLQPGNAEC